MLRALSCILIAGALLNAVAVTVTVFIAVRVTVTSVLFDVSLLVASPFYAFRAVTSASASSDAAAAALAALAALRFLGDRLEGEGDSVESYRRVK